MTTEFACNAFMHRTAAVPVAPSLRIEARRSAGGTWIVLEGFTEQGTLALDLTLDQAGVALLAPLFAEALPDALASLAQLAAIEAECEAEDAEWAALEAKLRSLSLEERRNLKEALLARHEAGSDMVVLGR